MSDINTAIFRREWYEAAKNRLGMAERLMFYESCFNYEFYEQLPNDETTSIVALAMFDMVKNTLEQDVEKAQARARKNRENGLKGGRPRAAQSIDEKETQMVTPKNPQNPNGFFGLAYTYPYTNTKKEKNISIFSKKNHSDFDNYLRFQYALIFFAKGATNAINEMEKFCNYYDSRGWCVSKDIPVQDRVALAKSWRIEYARPEYEQSRQPYVDLLQCIDAEEIELIQDFKSIERTTTPENMIIISYRETNRAANILEQKYLKELKEWRKIQSQGLEKTIKVEYRVFPKENALNLK